jgi:hypothetical protein
VRRNTTKIIDTFAFLTLMAFRQGLERNKCWAAAWNWKLDVVSIVLIYIQQQMGFILKYPVPNCKCGIIYSAYRGFILYCNWNRLTAETFGTFSCERKIFRKRVRKGNING